MSTTSAFNLSMVVTGMNLVGCAIEWFLIVRWGRRPLILWGMVSLAVCLLLIGVLGCVPHSGPVLQAIGAFMVMVSATELLRRSHT